MLWIEDTFLITQEAWQIIICFISDHVLWRNIFTGVIVGLFGLGIFWCRTKYITGRRRKNLITALYAEISVLQEHILPLKNIYLLRSLILNGETPFVTVDDKYPIFESHQSELSLLDNDALIAVIKYYEVDRFVAKSLLRFGDPDIQTLSKDRQIDAIGSFLDLAKKHESYGEKVVDILKARRERLHRLKMAWRWSCCVRRKGANRRGPGPG